MESESQITIRRRSGFSFGPVGYQVLLDGLQIATEAEREQVTIPVTPGLHRLSIQTPGWSSNIERFSVQPGEHIQFECGSCMWREWTKKKRMFWWASPFMESLFFRPCLTKVEPKP